MADATAAARREARRRKILQNSEARLKRLADIELEKQDTQSEDASEPVRAVHNKATTVSQTLAQNTRNEDLLQCTPPARQEDKPSAHPDSQNLMNRATEELTRDEEMMDTRGSIQARSNAEPKTQDSQNNRNTPDILNGVNVGISGARNSIQEDSVSQTGEVFWCGHTKHVILLVFAALVRFLLAREGLEGLVMKSAVIPFLMLECGVVGFDILVNKGSQTAQPTMSLLSTALVLSGVPKETIAMVTRTTAYLTAMLSDFALYMFAFLVTHSVLETVH